MLADTIEKHVKSKRFGGVSISSVLARRGNTGVDLRWYNQDESKQLNQAQKDELILWQTSEEGKTIIKANKNQLKAEHNAKKRKSEEEGGNSNKSGGGGDDKKTESKADKAQADKAQADKAQADKAQVDKAKDDKATDDKAEKTLQKKYQAAVVKASKKLVASSIEVERAECTAADLSLEAATKRRGDDSTKISATSVIQEDDAVAREEFTQKQTQIKLSTAKSKIN